MMYGNEYKIHLVDGETHRVVQRVVGTPYSILYTRINGNGHAYKTAANSETMIAGNPQKLRMSQLPPSVISRFENYIPSEVVSNW